MFFSHKHTVKQGILRILRQLRHLRLQYVVRVVQVVQPAHWRMVMVYGSLCIRFGTYVLIARALGTRDFGAFLFLQWIATLLLPLLGIGMTPLTNHALAKLQNSETFYSMSGIFFALWRQQCRRVILYGCVYIPVVSVFSIFMWRSIPPFVFLVAGLAALPLFFSGIVSTTLQGLHRYTLLACLRFASTALNFCLVLCAISLHRSLLEMFLLAPAFTGMVILVCALHFVARSIPLRAIPELGPLLRERLSKNVQPTWSLYLFDNAVWREFLFLVVLLLYWRTLSVPGFYAFSMLVCIHLTDVLPALFVLCLLPILSNFFPMQPHRSVYEAFVRMSSMIAMFAVALCTLLTLCSAQLITLFFGSDFQPMIAPLRILLIAVVFGSTASVSLTYLTSYNRRRELKWLSIITTILYIVLGIPCTLLWGIVGAAIAGTTAQVVASTGTIVLCRRFLLQYS